MELHEGKVLSRILLERYAKNPKNWSFTVSPSPKDGFFDALVANREEVWQLKLDSVFKSSPFVLGAKVDIDPSKITVSSSVPYGYRKLEPTVLLELLKSMVEEEGNQDNPRKLDSILGSLDTVVPTRGASYAEGPFVMTNKETTIISDGQRKLDDRLNVEMKKLLRNRFQSYG